MPKALLAAISFLIATTASAQEFAGAGLGVEDVRMGGIFALASHGDALYAGGRFTHAGGIWSPSIARWQDEDWSAVDGGANGAVRALLSRDGNLYAGGDFTEIAGRPAASIACFDGTVWREVDGGVDGAVHCLASFRGWLVVGGRFTRAGGVPASGLALWHPRDGWRAVDGNARDVVRCLLVVDNGARIVVGGNFRFPVRAGSQDQVVGIGRWGSRGWEAIGHAHSVRALALYRGQLVAAGAGIRTETVDSQVALLSGREWRSLGEETPFQAGRSVGALAVDESRLYAGGAFSGSVGGVVIRNIARWDGGRWSALAIGRTSGASLADRSESNGVSGTVEAAVLHRGALVLGGSFGNLGQYLWYDPRRWRVDGIVRIRDVPPPRTYRLSFDPGPCAFDLDHGLARTVGATPFGDGIDFAIVEGSSAAGTFDLVFDPSAEVEPIEGAAAGYSIRTAEGASFEVRGLRRVDRTVEFEVVEALD